MKKSSFLAAALMAMMASPAFAHLNPAEHGSLAAGLTHPMSGADHILAMIAVGLWASLLGGRALMAVPMSFVGLMLVGFVVAMGNVSLPFVEPVILASVVILGLTVALSLRAPTALASAIVGFFAFFHGYAHGGEIGAATVSAYAAGFALATIILHAAGMALGLSAQRFLHGATGSASLRLAGALAAGGGLYLMAG